MLPPSDSDTTLPAKPPYDPNRGIVSRRPGDRFVEHPIAVDAQHRIRAHIEHGLHKSGADIMTLTGPSGSGKTEIVRALMSQPEFAKRRGEDGREIQPIAYVETAVGETPKSLAISILKALDDYKPDRGSQMEIQARAPGLLVQRGVRLLIIDETQLLSRNTYDAGDFFRQFVNQPIVPLLLVGLPSVEDLVRANAQVGRRARPGINLSAFDWNDREQRGIFRNLLKTLYSLLPSPYDVLPVDFQHLTQAYYITSGGLIGRLTQLLDVALENAVHQNATELTPEILGEAYEKIKPLYDAPPENAFRLKFLPHTMKKAANTTGMRQR